MDIPNETIGTPSVYVLIRNATCGNCKCYGGFRQCMKTGKYTPARFYCDEWESED